MQIRFIIFFMLLSMAGIGQVYDTIPVRLLVSDTSTGNVKVISTKEIREIKFIQSKKRVNPNTITELSNGMYSTTSMSTYIINVIDTTYTHYKYIANLSKYTIWQKQ